MTWVTWWDSQHNIPFRTAKVRRKTHTMKIAILDDYQDAVRKLDCFQLLADHEVKVFNNTVRGLGQLASRLSEVDALVLIRERTRISPQLLDKLPRLRMISQTGKVSIHIDLAACTERGIAVLEGTGSPFAPAELTWALIMAAQRRIPQYVANLKQGAWQQSGLKTSALPPNFGLGQVLRGQTLGIWGYGKIGRLVAGYGKAFGMNSADLGAAIIRAKPLAPTVTASPKAARRCSSKVTCCRSICACTTTRAAS